MTRTLQLPEDPLSRFESIYEALNAERGWWNDASPLRFAAVSALTCPGAPGSVAVAIRKSADDIKAESGWFGTLNSQLRFVVGTLLVLHEDNAADFLVEVRRVRDLFREVSLRRSAIYETMAILILRMQAEKKPIQMTAVNRFRDIYEEMKRHRWWLTGPEDFPACAMLVGRDGLPGTIGADIEAIYQALQAAGFTSGDPLQTAANILYLAGMGPEAVARRYHELAEGFRENGVSIWQSDYDELAILTFLKHPAQRVIDTVLQHREVMKTLRPKPDRLLTFNLAASVTFLELVRVDVNLRMITDAKALLDMQAIINAQQAAAAAATASAASTSAASS